MSFDTAVNTSAHYLAHPDNYDSRLYELAIYPLNDDELEILGVAVPILQNIAEQSRKLAKSAIQEKAALIGDDCNKVSLGCNAGILTLELWQFLLNSNLLERIIQIASPVLSGVSIISQVGAVATIAVVPIVLNSAMKDQNRGTKIVGTDMKGTISDKINERARSQQQATISQLQATNSQLQSIVMQQQETMNNFFRYISVRDGLGANQLTEGNENDNQIGDNGANLALPQHSAQ